MGWAWEKLINEKKPDVENLVALSLWVKGKQGLRVKIIYQPLPTNRKLGKIYQARHPFLDQTRKNILDITIKISEQHLKKFIIQLLLWFKPRSVKYFKEALNISWHNPFIPPSHTHSPLMKPLFPPHPLTVPFLVYIRRMSGFLVCFPLHIVETSPHLP
jgi:hypothetical protein